MEPCLRQSIFLEYRKLYHVQFSQDFRDVEILDTNLETKAVFTLSKRANPLFYWFGIPQIPVVNLGNFRSDLKLWTRIVWQTNRVNSRVGLDSRVHEPSSSTGSGLVWHTKPGGGAWWRNCSTNGHVAGICPVLLFLIFIGWIWGLSSQSAEEINVLAWMERNGWKQYISILLLVLEMVPGNPPLMLFTLLAGSKEYFILIQNT